MFNPSSASWHIEWNLSLEIGQRTRAGESDYARETSCVRDGLLIKTKKKKNPSYQRTLAFPNMYWKYILVNLLLVVPNSRILTSARTENLPGKSVCLCCQGR